MPFCTDEYCMYCCICGVPFNALSVISRNTLYSNCPLTEKIAQWTYELQGVRQEPKFVTEKEDGKTDFEESTETRPEQLEYRPGEPFFVSGVGYMSYALGVGFLPEPGQKLSAQDPPPINSLVVKPKWRAKIPGYQHYDFHAGRWTEEPGLKYRVRLYESVDVSVDQKCDLRNDPPAYPFHAECYSAFTKSFQSRFGEEEDVDFQKLYLLFRKWDVVDDGNWLTNCREDLDNYKYGGAEEYCIFEGEPWEDYTEIGYRYAFDQLPLGWKYFVDPTVNHLISSPWLTINKDAQAWTEPISTLEVHPDIALVEAVMKHCFLEPMNFHPSITSKDDKNMETINKLQRLPLEVVREVFSHLPSNVVLRVLEDQELKKTLLPLPLAFWKWRFEASNELGFLYPGLLSNLGEIDKIDWRRIYGYLGLLSDLNGDIKWPLTAYEHNYRAAPSYTGDAEFDIRSASLSNRKRIFKCAENIIEQYTLFDPEVLESFP